MGESVDELSRLLAQPSVAAQNLGIEDCAELVADALKLRGFSVSIMPTGGSPVVFGERKGQGDATLISYNHYDVQPAEPLELWDSPPFEPTLRDGRLYARGVSDNKGNFTARLHAIDAILDREGELPCNVKFIVEGEEEIGSVNLEPFVRANKDLLAGDVCVWEVGGVDHENAPIQMLGLRGICYVELRVRTATQDVHSGTGGSLFPNAAWRLVWALSTLKDPCENILLPGFYESVIPPTPREKELLAQLPDMRAHYREVYGLEGFLKGVDDPLELAIQAVYQPTCTICGLNSGYQGEGSKTVLPAEASAKVDFRLVPDQRPQQVLAQLREHLDAHGFSDIEIVDLGGNPGARTDPDHPAVGLAVRAAEDVYDKPTRINPMIGGSGPNFMFQEYLGVPIISNGANDADSRAHAPNESISLDLYAKAAKHFARILMLMRDY
ncbi:MAG TPA: M20/M25/M40 family metallo-hydrolase [Brevefilum sp.]|nr:M20/M25/M40 family metallo-hydrolase [Brevefilum sp.]HOR18989.1 M20/M25/M40 family metallo-hydrolase [Brevefilum sp.]HPL69332.1 M20/M25/M40 family metallo-hydrolase [Brevefilum sp.]